MNSLCLDGKTRSAESKRIQRTSSANPKILSVVHLNRPEGYSLPGYRYVAMTIEADGTTANGYGAGHQKIALEKAYSEALERLTLFQYCKAQQTEETSNGWACHISEDLAIESALLELVERDVALRTWLDLGTFYELPLSVWPVLLNDWKLTVGQRSEFFKFRIFLSENENGCCISALLFNEKGNFVAGHASGLDLKKAIESAAVECMRAAHAALRFEHFAATLKLHDNSALDYFFDPGVHSLAYAYSVTLPSEIVIFPITEALLYSKWQEHASKISNLSLEGMDISTFKFENRVVARVKSDRHMEVFWGHPPKNIKFRNKHPHIVG